MKLAEQQAFHLLHFYIPLLVDPPFNNEVSAVLATSDHVGTATMLTMLRMNAKDMYQDKTKHQVYSRIMNGELSTTDLEENPYVMTIARDIERNLIRPSIVVAVKQLRHGMEHHAQENFTPSESKKAVVDMINEAEKVVVQAKKWKTEDIQELCAEVSTEIEAGKNWLHSKTFYESGPPEDLWSRQVGFVDILMYPELLAKINHDIATINIVAAEGVEEESVGSSDED